MKDDEALWDSRYRAKKFPDTANDLVRNFYHLAEKGRALDIAAGNGRNAFFLADKGFQVEAVDISGVAIDLIRTKNPDILSFHEDLNRYIPARDSFDLIININFLDRRLFPHIKRALRKNGILIFKTFLDSHFQNSSQPNSNIDHYLQSNELLHAFLSLQILYYREEEIVWSNREKRMEARLIARKKDNSD